MAQFTLRHQCRCSYDDALGKIPAALASEGFGVLTEIDVKDTLKRKLNLDFRRYRILGACNPSLAHQALSAELDVGVMLPCNIVVYENDNGEATVLAIDPMQTMASAVGPAMREIAGTVRQKLEKVLARID